jgi:hypothetical protein
MIYDMICLTAIVLTTGGRSTVHIYTQKIHRTIQSTQTIHRTTQFTNYLECGPCPAFARLSLAFALQLRKKNGDKKHMHIAVLHMILIRILIPMNAEVFLNNSKECER